MRLPIHTYPTQAVPVEADFCSWCGEFLADCVCQEQGQSPQMLPPVPAFPIDQELRRLTALPKLAVSKPRAISLWTREVELTMSASSAGFKQTWSQQLQVALDTYEIYLTTADEQRHSIAVTELPFDQREQALRPRVLEAIPSAVKDDVLSDETISTATASLLFRLLIDAQVGTMEEKNELRQSVAKPAAAKDFAGAVRGIHEWRSDRKRMLQLKMQECDPDTLFSAVNHIVEQPMQKLTKLDDAQRKWIDTYLREQQLRA